MVQRFNPPPNWPPPPPGWAPEPGWAPDPAWGPAPDGWHLWVDEADASTSPSAPAFGTAEPFASSSLSQRKPWPVRHKLLTGAGAVVVLLMAIGILNGADPDETASVAPVPPSMAASDADDDESAVEDRAASQEADDERRAQEARLAEEQRLADEAAAAEATAAAAAEAARIGSIAQQNAYRSAVSYLDFSAFSRSGLIDQLEYEGFATGDAEFALARLEAEGGVDWNAQAAASAASYLEFSAFSRSSLVDQLLYEGFSAEQAEYGVSTTGL